MQWPLASHCVRLFQSFYRVNWVTVPSFSTLSFQWISSFSTTSIIRNCRPTLCLITFFGIQILHIESVASCLVLNGPYIFFSNLRSIRPLPELCTHNLKSVCWLRISFWEIALVDTLLFLHEHDASIDRIMKRADLLMTTKGFNAFKFVSGRVKNDWKFCCCCWMRSCYLINFVCQCWFKGNLNISVWLYVLRFPEKYICQLLNC